MIRFVALLVSLCLVVWGVPRSSVAAPAGGSELRAVVLPLDIEGELSPPDASALTHELVAGLERGGFEVVPPDVTADAGARASCDTPRCLRRLAEANDASHLVRARIGRSDRDYTVAVELFDGRTGASLASIDSGCEICGVADVRALVESAAATLRTKLDALAVGPPVLVVTSAPKGARVSLDAQVVGTTPMEIPVSPGKRGLRIELPGYVPQFREITFVEGVTETVGVELEKIPSRLPERRWGWAALGVGLGSLGASVGFAALRNRPYRLGGACDEGRRDAAGRCPNLWSTEWHVLGFGLAGAALTTLGVVILVDSRGRNGKRTAARAPRLRLGAGALEVSGRF